MEGSMEQTVHSLLKAGIIGFKEIQIVETVAQTLLLLTVTPRRRLNGGNVKKTLTYFHRRSGCCWVKPYKALTHFRTHMPEFIMTQVKKKKKVKIWCWLKS